MDDFSSKTVWEMSQKFANKGLMIWNDLGYWKTLKFTTNKRKESVADVGNFEIAERRIDFGDADQRRKESGIHGRTNVPLECL